MRVATGYKNQEALRQIQRSQQDITRTTAQITSGQKHQTLSEMADDAPQVLDMRDVISNTNMYLDNIQTATNRLKSTESTLQKISDLLSQAASLSTTGRNENTAATRAALGPKAKGLTDTFYSLLNTKFDGQYIFSGSNGKSAPINTTPTATAFPGAPVPKTYYQGDTQRQQIISGPGSTSSYGVTGDHDAFAKMKAGLEALWHGLENNSVGDLDNAITILKEAQKDISSLQGDVGGQIQNMDLMKERHTTQQTFMQERLDELTKADVPTALTKISEQQTVLQASMSVITQINKLSLLDFLR